MKLPRGLRNNNPLNIIKGVGFIGEVEGTDPNFAQFSTLEYGYRAAFLLIKKYINVHHADTIAKIVHRWSPDGEKAERSYMQSVSRWTAIDVNQTLSFTDKRAMIAIVQAMAQFENGCTIDPKPIRATYEKYF